MKCRIVPTAETDCSGDVKFVLGGEDEAIDTEETTYLANVSACMRMRKLLMAAWVVARDIRAALI